MPTKMPKARSTSTETPGDAGLFSPKPTAIFPPVKGAKAAAGDRRDGSVYVYAVTIILAVRVAQVTNRPILVRGSSGNGKSSLARNGSSSARTAAARCASTCASTRSP